MTDEDICIVLLSKCDHAGSQAVWAKAHGFRPSYISDVLNGRRPPSPQLGAVLGYKPLPRQWIRADERRAA